MNQRVSSSTMLAGIFLVSTLLFYLPQIETLSAWGIRVKLQATLRDAEQIVEKLKKLAEVNAKVTYLTVAWGNRLGSPSAAEKQSVLDEMNNQLNELKVDEAERKAIAKPLIVLIGVDLYQVYDRVMERFVFWTQRNL